ncbi:17311_t:CDS:1, partial [Cetraspora pellucida]
SKTKILSGTFNNNLNTPFNDFTPTLREINKEIAILNLSNMIAKELLNNSDEKIVYEMPNNDKIIENLVELYKQLLNIQTDINEEDIDDSIEPLI